MRKIFIVLFILCLTNCAFHLRGPLPLPFKQIYLQTSDPYGQLTKDLKQYLHLSGVYVTEKPEEAGMILTILSENKTQQLLGISGTQQTRQYNLNLIVVFQITDKQGQTKIPLQTVTETRTLTIKSDQILASSNEANNLYQQMQQAIVYDIVSRLSSKEISLMMTSS